ncbi:MAG: sigma-70 family RNA polymerase sigma factor [Polyangiaceae bacterium]
MAQLLRDHFGEVWRLLRRFGLAPDVADDASQEVFLVASRKFREADLPTARRFLYGVALRVAANARRSQRQLNKHRSETEVGEVPSGTPSSEELLRRKRARELLERFVNEMPDDLATAFVMFELEGMSLDEIARLLSIPLGTVSSRLRRAREAFKLAMLRARESGDIE